jgi:hypothetical protein
LHSDGYQARPDSLTAAARQLCRNPDTPDTSFPGYPTPELSGIVHLESRGRLDPAAFRGDRSSQVTDEPSFGDGRYSASA